MRPRGSARDLVRYTQNGPERGTGPSKGGPVPPRADTGLSGAPMAVLRAMSEAELLDHVVGALEARGWLVFHVPDSRRMAAGLADVIAVQPGQLLLLELKREAGFKITSEQQAFIDCAATVLGVTARILRPSQWAAFLEDLGR